MIPEREREALMRLTMCARIECDICKYKDSSIDECNERITQNMNILADALRADRKTENSSEIPNNCEHITEDGVTCAKYPACDDCLDNPLNKIKGSERLVKGLEKPTTDCKRTDCRTCKWWSIYGYCVHRECKGYEPQTERSSE